MPGSTSKLVLAVILTVSFACASTRGRSTLLTFGPPPGAGTQAAGQDEDPHIQADRPDVSNAAYTVPKGLAQLEAGGDRSRVEVSGESVATPVTVRLGISHWAELRAESDGLLRSRQPGGTSTEFAGLSVGGKFRLWAPGNGAPVVAVEPEVTLPWQRSGGGTDFTLRAISGGDFTQRVHVDVNYGIGAIAADASHFTQHMASLSTSVSAGQWSPFVEVYWFSKLEPDARPSASIDSGVVYTLKRRIALDAGVAFGLTAAANGPALFGGVSVIVGEVSGHRGVYARLREAQLRGDR